MKPETNNDKKGAARRTAKQFGAAPGSANHGQEPPAERTSDAVRSGVGGEPRLVITSGCAGHSSYLHCAIRLFEELKDRISSWGVGVSEGLGSAELVMNGKCYIEEDPDLAQAIGKAVARALREAGGGGAELGANVIAGESQSGAGSQSAGDERQSRAEKTP